MATAGRRPSARERGETIDGYIAKQAPDAADAIRTLCAVVRKAAPEAIGSIKWGQPVFEQNGPFAFIKAAKRHVTIGFWRGAEIPDPDGALEGSGDVMRHLKIPSATEVPIATVDRMVRVAVELNLEHGDPTRRR